jgi:hypothetical protein
LSTRVDELVSRIISVGDDEATRELLDEFYSGHPIQGLRRLLQSDKESAVEAGAWIASELGDAVAPIIPELYRLTSHPSKRVRFFVLDALLNAGTPEYGEALAAAVERIQDPDEVVRWKAMNFLARASDGQLTASLGFISRSDVASAIRWLLDSDRRLDTLAVVHRLEHSDQLSRHVAAATAVRLASRDDTALKRAVACLDREINSFAREQVRLSWWR